MQEPFKELEARCERLLKKPRPTAEPRTYPPGTVRLSEEWREIWWGNRLYTISRAPIPSSTTCSPTKNATYAAA